MYRTLQHLKESVENLISQQGADAPCAAFIFTQEDVFEMDENCDTHHLPLDVAKKVLDEVNELDYIYEQVFEVIDEVINRINVNS